MKISMFITQDAIQFNLEGESEHEKEYLELLNSYTGEVDIMRGADIGMCRSNYIRSFSNDLPRAIAITIHKPKKVGN
jgi:hypothetical protein